MKNHHFSHNFGHIVEKKYIDFINENWQGFNDKISDLFFPYEDKNILKFPTVKELIPLLNEDDMINFCINTHPDYTRYPPKLFKQDINVKEFDIEVLKIMENRVVRNLRTTIGDDTVTLKHIIELVDLEETVIKEIRLNETTC